MLKTLTSGPFLWERLCRPGEFQAIPIEGFHVYENQLCFSVHHAGEPFLDQLPALKMTAVITISVHCLALNNFRALTGLFALGVAKEFQALPVGVGNSFHAGWDRFIAVAAVHLSHARW